MNEADIRVVLSRLPSSLWRGLRAVHLNDGSWGGRVFGYVNRARREISLCALPPRMSLTKALLGRQRPDEFGARRGHKWPAVAIRRFMLYNVFLHEVGHLQLVNAHSRSARLKYAHEKLAQEFAVGWRRQLWARPFDHADPAHNPPAPEELALLHFASDRVGRDRQGLS